MKSGLMICIRICLAVLIAVSPGVLPGGFANAAGESAPAKAAMSMAGMEDCERDSGTPSHEDCPDCTEHAKCTLDCCALKCFPRFIEPASSLRFLTFAGANYLTANAETPAQRHHTPQPPPPRS
jgi:hypothetical protein